MVPQVWSILGWWMMPSMDDSIARLDCLTYLRVTDTVERHPPPRCEQIELSAKRAAIEIKQLFPEFLACRNLALR